MLAGWFSSPLSHWGKELRTPDLQTPEMGKYYYSRDYHSQNWTHFVMGWIVYSPKFVCFEVLTSGCDCIWSQDLYRGNSVKIRSLEWALIWYDWPPCKKRKFGHIHTKERCEDTRRRPPSTSQREKPRKDLPGGYQKKLTLLTAWSQIPSFQNYEKTNIWCLNHQSMVLCYRSPNTGSSSPSL